MPNPQELAAIFLEVRERLEASGNFIWSSWEDAEDALREIDGVLASLRGGVVPGVTVYFLPTGPIQEVAMSSGWGDEFLVLANRFDRAMAGGCRCFLEPSPLVVAEKSFALDRWYADIRVDRCPECGQLWMRYFWESEATSRSGRWYLGAITPGQARGLTSDNAKGMLESLDWYYYGGSYYGGKVGKTSGPILLAM